MAKKLTTRDINRAIILVKHMRFDKNTKKFVDCWWNSMIRKCVKYKLGVEPEYIAMQIIECELKKRGV